MAKKKVYAVRKGKKQVYFILGMNVKPLYQAIRGQNIKDSRQKKKQTGIWA